MYYIVGLGNPGGEYELSRHNTGRIIVGEFMKSAAKKGEVSELKADKKLKALVAAGEISFTARGKKEKFQIILPETFMNKSGLSLKPIVGKIVKKKKVRPADKRGASHWAEKLIVIHDDVDLPLGKYKVSFGKGSAGHKGVESIIRNIKTKEFIRIRVGVSPATPKGKIKKAKGEKMLDFIIGNFKPNETQILKKTSKKITSLMEAILEYGLDKAMSLKY